MRRFLVVALLVLAGCTIGLCQSSDGYLTVAFGSVRGPDGKMHSIKGLRLPYHAETIHAPIISGSIKPDPPPPGTDAQTVYNSDSGTYGIIDPGEFDDPSSLDDIFMSGGAGNPWQELTFGINISVQRTFLIRWRCYSTYTQGGGHNVSSFSNEFADFGVIVPSSTFPTGSSKITISVSAAAVVAPQNQMYMAQQFRTPQPNGEGPFDTAFRSVYNTGALPTTGSSNNGFWFDADPLNGIYADDEFDQFHDPGSQPPPYSNHLRAIAIGGNSAAVQPATATIVDGGSAVSGDVFDLWQNDQLYFIGQRFGPNPFGFLIDSGPAPSANLTTLKFTVDAQSSVTSLMKIEFWNYQMNRFDIVANNVQMDPTDRTYEVLIQTNPTRYINSSTRRMRAKVSFRQPVTRLMRTWQVKMDLANWTVSYP